MSKTKLKAFKIFDCNRKRVFLLPPAAFKVWMYHFSREGPDKTKGSYPSLELISKELGMPVKLVKKQRRALLLHGWLKRVGEKKSKRSQDSSGKFNIPIMMVDEGTIPQGRFYPMVEKKAPRVKMTPRQQGQNDPQKYIQKSKYIQKPKYMVFPKLFLMINRNPWKKFGQKHWINSVCRRVKMTLWLNLLPPLSHSLS